MWHQAEFAPQNSTGQPFGSWTISSRYNILPCCLGVCQVKKMRKIREKLGSGWVGQAPTRILFYSWKCCVFFCFCVCFLLLYMFPKKWDRGGWWVGSGQSVFFFGFLDFLT